MLTSIRIKRITFLADMIFVDFLSRVYKQARFSRIRGLKKKKNFCTKIISSPGFSPALREKWSLVFLSIPFLTKNRYLFSWPADHIQSWNSQSNPIDLKSNR
jgi:hypothetical protein